MGKNVNKAADEVPALIGINKDKILGEVHETLHIKFIQCIIFRQVEEKSKMKRSTKEMQDVINMADFIRTHT